MISYKAEYKTSTEQQHAFFDKDFVINLLKDRITGSKSRLKKKEAVNDFLMSILKTNSSGSYTQKILLNETPNGSNNSRTESPSQEYKYRNLTTRAAKNKIGEKKCNCYW